MFPEAVVAPLELIVESLAAFALHKALAFTSFIDDNDSELRVDFSVSVPIAASCADLQLGRKNQFFAHV